MTFHSYDVPGTTEIFEPGDRVTWSEKAFNVGFVEDANRDDVGTVIAIVIRDGLFTRLASVLWDESNRLMEIKTLYAAEWQVMPAKWAQILDDEYEDAIGSSREAAE